MKILRDWNRTEADDFALNVERRLNEFTEAIPFYHEGIVYGWFIKNKYE